MKYFIEDNKRCIIMIVVAFLILGLGAGFKSIYLGGYQKTLESYKQQVADKQDERDLLNEELAKTSEKVEKDSMAITADTLTKHQEIANKYFTPYYAWDSKDTYDKAMKEGKEKFSENKKAFAKKFGVDADAIEKKKQKSAISSLTLYPRKVEGGTVLYYAKVTVERTELEADASQVENLLSFSINADGDVARVKMMY